MIGKIVAGLSRDYAPRNSGRKTAESDYWMPSSRVAGQAVTIERALGLGTVYACIRILAETVGTTPILVYREPGEGDRRRAKNSPAWSLLHDEPNPGMSPVDLWTLMMTWLAGWGDAFLGKQFARNGEVVALWPIHPSAVTVSMVNGVKQFEVKREDGVRESFTSTEVIHVMGQSFDGVRGSSPLRWARSEIGVSLAAQEMAAATYANTAVPRGVLKHKDRLTDDAGARLRADWQRLYGGSKNAGKVAILEEGMEFQGISLPLSDVQYVEQQQLSVQVIARLFRVPLSLIQAESPGGLTYRTAESENMQFLTHGVRPWYERIEQAISRDPDLFPLRPVEYAEFLPDALLRVATLDRFNAYSIATGNKPWMLPSEVRTAENLPKDDSVNELPAAAAVPSVPADEPAEAAQAPA